MSWKVTIKKSVKKQLSLLPENVRKSMVLLMREMEIDGPIRGNWPNYGKLSDHIHHCHLKKGSPTYVAVWKVMEKEVRLIEVTYVGTHEKAPY
jgi:mRNA-degrading endonuclease RelE of RelBE toxin-antitoxin system